MEPKKTMTLQDVNSNIGYLGTVKSTAMSDFSIDSSEIQEFDRNIIVDQH